MLSQLQRDQWKKKCKFYPLKSSVLCGLKVFSWECKLVMSNLLVLYIFFEEWCLGCSVVKKKSACQCRRCRFNPWVRKIPWSRQWQPTLVFLPGESPWTEEPGRLQSVGSQRVRHDWVTKHITYCGSIVGN